ncbi:MAG: hypothetical protein HUU01_14115 [Saprospiraceae bacterium]|nr:hypothetical protein [Saprospiraceae bacterium]
MEPLYALKWAKSKLLLDAFIEQYNAGRKLGEQLRANHKTLAEKLLFLYSAMLAREQAYGSGPTPGAPLPLLRTNNAQLCEMMGCSERTIINLRARLKASKLITHEIFHGSNAQYEMALASAVMHVEQRGAGPENLTWSFSANPAPPHNDKAQTLRHTVTSTGQVSNQLIELDGAPFQRIARIGESAGICPVENCSGGVENVRKSVEKPLPGSEPGAKPGTGKTGYDTATTPTGTPPHSAAPPAATAETVVASGAQFLEEPPATAPKTFREAVAGLSRQVQTAIERHVQVIYTCAMLQLYADKWIADEVAERAKAALAEYFAYTTPDRYAAGSTEIIERILLVRKWIERAPEGEKRWVPLPDLYFDFRTPKGFSATKPWFKKHIKCKADIKANELLTKAVNEYLKALAPGAVIGPSETYRKISQRLGKYDRALLDRFHHQISQLNHERNANATTATG